MSNRTNEFNQPIGPDLFDWRPPLPPSAAVLAGRFTRLERLAVHHTAELYRAFREGENAASDWTYLSYGPFRSEEDFASFIEKNATFIDPFMYSIMLPEGAGYRAAGVAGYLRIAPEAGSVEVGHIHFGRRLQRTTAATEAMYLMARHAFELGYRRYEWKCDALNEPSRAAAQRFGFSFEGAFRNATVYKNRSRDTAWFAMTVEDWPAIRAAYERWLSPGNLEGGGPRVRLSDLTRPLLHSLFNA